MSQKKDFSFISTETKQEVYYEVKNNNFSLNFAYKLNEWYKIYFFC